MQVVGVTTQQEVYVASKERKFRMNEILLIEDASQHLPKGEVVETLSYNRFIPMGLDKSLVDAQVIATLEQIGMDIRNDEINIAKVRLFEEAMQPIQTGAAVRTPEFHEVESLLMKTEPNNGMVVGEIRSTEHMHSTLPKELSSLMSISEQDVLREQRGVPFIFHIKAMQQYPHIGVFGGSGSGKSFGLRVMLEELMKLNIPTLVFDPHFEMSFATSDEEGNRHRSFSYDDRYFIVQVGKDVGVDFSALSTRDIERLLHASASLTESMVNAVQTLHKRKDSFQSFSDRVANLATALEVGKQKVDAIVHDGHLSRDEFERYDTFKKLLDQFGSLPLASVKGIQWRLGRLQQSGLFQHHIRAIEQGLETGKLVVIQGSVWLLQVFASYVIGTLYNKRRSYKDARLQREQADFFPPFLIVTDEAHNFAPKGFDAPAKSVIKEIAQEGRKYGVFLILATQRPTLLDETITAQLNSKFVFRTVRSTDIQTIKEETDLTHEEGKRLPYLRSGDAFVSSAIFGRTIPIRIRYAHTTSPHVLNPFDELDMLNAETDERLLQALEDLFPIDDVQLIEQLEGMNRKLGKKYSLHELKSELERLAKSGKIKREKTPFATMYDRA